MNVKPIIAPIGIGDIVGDPLHYQRKKAPSPSVTPTITLTPTITATITPSLTPSASHIPVSPTITPTLTASRTPAPTATPTASSTPTVTVTPTVSRTPGFSPTPSSTPTPTPTPSPSPVKLELILSEIVGGEVGIPYTGRLTSTDNTGNAIYSVWFSTLPPGITLSVDGYFQGIPTEEGYFEVGLQVSNTVQMDPELYTIVIKRKRHD